MSSPKSPSDTNTNQPCLSPEESRLLRLYGRRPSQSQHFARHLKERKYFDSGDYALSKAGRGNSVDVGAVGSLHPAPQMIPHPNPSFANTRLTSGSGSGSRTVSGPVTMMGARKSSLSVSM